MSFILRAMQKASGTFGRTAIALLIACAIGSAAASASEFEGYKKPDPQRFAQGVAAYDAGNYSAAFDIWLPMARHRDLAAIFNIGLMLRDGRGVARNLPRALSFFKQGAAANHLGSQVTLADMYYRGTGTQQDYAQAAKWLMIAARRGHYPSMYRLGGMFERGEGVGVNLEAARTLYLTAYEGGYQLAGNRLSEIATKANGSAVPARAVDSVGNGPQLTTAPRPPTSKPQNGAVVTLPQLRGTIGTVP